MNNAASLNRCLLPDLGDTFFIFIFSKGSTFFSLAEALYQDIFSRREFNCEKGLQSRSNPVSRCQVKRVFSLNRLKYDYLRPYSIFASSFLSPPCWSVHLRRIQNAAKDNRIIQQIHVSITTVMNYTNTYHIILAEGHYCAVL